jgi:1,4-alpha-glucan branching enzyme
MRSSLHLPIGRAAALLLQLSLAITTSGCALLGFVEDRLPPPEEGADGIVFRYKAPAARQVNVAGEFNNWVGTQDTGRIDPNIDPMSDADGDGIWEITLPLPPGRYQYKFLVDQVDWQEDPGNPETTDDGFGGKNSILVVNSNVRYAYDEAYVSFSLGTSARITTQRDHEFVLEGHAGAKEVFVTGSFADWNPSAQRMNKDADGVWRATLRLRDGKHLYKFVVDGNWIADPGNPDGENDGFGGTNSVLVIQS